MFNDGYNTGVKIYFVNVKFILLMSNLFNIRLNSFRFYAADSLLDKTLGNCVGS